MADATGADSQTAVPQPVTGKVGVSAHISDENGCVVSQCRWRPKFMLTVVLTDTGLNW